MAFTTPATWSTGEVLLASKYNVQIRDNIAAMILPRFIVLNDTDAAHLTNRITLANALASPPTIGQTTPAPVWSSNFHVTGAASTSRSINFRTNGVARWTIRASDATESGGNTGSTFQILRHNDAGTVLNTPLNITRDGGAFQLFTNSLTMTASAGLSPTIILTTNHATEGGEIQFGNSPGAVVPHVITLDRVAAQIRLFRADAAAGISDFAIFNAGAGGKWRVGINVPNPTYDLQLANDSAAKPTTNTWTVASDQRLKETLGQYTEGLQAIIGLPQPVLFRYNGLGGMPEGTEGVGWIAQELKLTQPTWVKASETYLPGDPDPVLYVNSGDLMYMLINAIRELHERIETLENSQP